MLLSFPERFIEAVAIHLFGVAQDLGNYINYAPLCNFELTISRFSSNTHT